MSIEQLGADQVKWLNEYRNIDLEDWRKEIIPTWDKNPAWYYIGNSLRNKESLAERRHKLELDKYHYWPKTSSALGEKWNPKYVGSIESWTELWKKHHDGKVVNIEDVKSFCNDIWFSK